MGQQGVYYREIGKELLVFKACVEKRLPILLVGPTGCGKSRLVHFVSEKLNRPLIQVSCNEDTTGADLLGRFLLKGSETLWQDGPITRAVRQGAILYLDEIAEARDDVTVLIHPLTDFRRSLYVDRINEEIHAEPSFSVVASFNPGYQSSFKELKPSTRQRFVTIAMAFPPAEVEAEIVATETECDRSVSKRLVGLANRIRGATELTLRETVSTRLLVNAALLHQTGLSLRDAALHSVASCLSDDPETNKALADLVCLML